MKNKNAYVFVVLSLLLGFLSACVKDVDFGQLEEIELTPVVELDFVYSKLTPADYIDPDTQIPLPDLTISDVLNYDLLGSEDVVDNVERVELTLVFENSIDRSFTMNLQLLDDAEAVQYTFPPIMVASGMPGDPVTTTSVLVLNMEDLTNLVNATKLLTQISIESSDASLQGTLELKSKATYFIRYTTS